MGYKILTDSSKVSDVQLEALFASSKTTNFFQTKSAIHFFKSVGTDTFFYALEKNSKIEVLVTGIIQKEKGVKAMFSRRAIIYGGPVVEETASDPQIKSLLQELLNGLKKRAIYVEIRNLNDYTRYKDLFIQLGFKSIPHLNFHLDCTNEAAVRKKMSSSKLRQVKKSLKSGAEIIEATTINQVMEFYEILEHLYKTKVKTPLQDKTFFVELWRQKTAKFLLIQYEEKIIGGIVCPILPEQVIYEWYVCGIDGHYKNVYPSILATWAAMDYAVKNNIPRFDFMGAGKPDEDYGVREFKSKFGGDLVAHDRFLYIAQPILYQLGKTVVKLLKRI